MQTYGNPERGNPLSVIDIVSRERMVGRDNFRIRPAIGLVLWSCGLPVGVCRETF